MKNQSFESSSSRARQQEFTCVAGNRRSTDRQGRHAVHGRRGEVSGLYGLTSSLSWLEGLEGNQFPGTVCESFDSPQDVRRMVL